MASFYRASVGPPTSTSHVPPEADQCRASKGGLLALGCVIVGVPKRCDLAHPPKVQNVVLQLLFDFVNELLMNRHGPFSERRVATCRVCTLSTSFPALMLTRRRRHFNPCRHHVMVRSSHRCAWAPPTLLPPVPWRVPAVGGLTSPALPARIRQRPSRAEAVARDCRT